jgi:hypothetical protein
MFDNYVSLGRNCEIAFQFRRILGYDVAYYFNWLLTPFDALIEVIRADFTGTYQKANIEVTANPGMILDRQYGIKYHSAFKKELGRNLSGPRFDELYEESARKYSFLAQRFRELASSPNRVLYFVKTEEDGAKDKSITLRETLASRYPNHDFSLLVLQTESNAEDDWREPRIFNRYLERFAHPNRANDGHIPSWDRIFLEFPLRPGAMPKSVPLASPSDRAAVRQRTLPQRPLDPALTNQILVDGGIPAHAEPAAS